MSDHTSSLFLASLSPDDLSALLPHLKSVDLEQAVVLSEAGELVTAVYFPTGAVVSLVAVLSTGQTIEAAMVGRDGVVGSSAALDSNISFCRAVIQLAGTAMRCEPEALKAIVLQSRTLLSKVIRHEQALYAQAQQSAACMASHTVEARLCRWLLRARDLSGGDMLPFTQEYLAEMLGVRRTSVSDVAQTLQTAGLIKYARGRIEILNGAGIEAVACECYASVRDHHKVLLGTSAGNSNVGNRT